MGLPGILSGLGGLVSGALASPKAVNNPIDAVRAAVQLVDHLYPDDQEKLDRTAVLARIVQNADSLQASINRIEASSRSMLVAGWRPFIGWVCGITLAWHFLIQPILLFGLEAAGMDPLEWRHFDLTMLDTILFGILGLGTLRTAEKATGRA